MAGQFLTLSLFLMLLSFFIILNSVSKFEVEKARSAIMSVSIAFSKQGRPEQKQPEVEFSDQLSVRKGTSLDGINELFKSQFSGVEISKNRLGTEMRIRMKVSDFEQLLNAPPPEEGQVLTQNGKNFFPLLISLMDAEDDIPYRMDILTHTQDNPSKLQKESPQTIVGQAKAVSSYAEKLELLGLPSRLVTSGLTQGEPGMMDLVLHRYIPFDPSGGKEASEAQP